MILERRRAGLVLPGGPPPSGPLDPRTVPALMAGGIWLPGVGITSLPNSSRRWASQSNNTGNDYDLKDTGSGYKPTATTASNGAAVYALAGDGSKGFWAVAGPDGGNAYDPRPPGAALQFTNRGSYALWLKANSLDTSIHVLLSMWPGGTTGNRLYFHKNDDNYRLAWYISRDGSAVDEAPPTLSHRSKGNTGSGVGQGALIDWTAWHFVRIEWVGTGANYSLSGGNYSDKVLVWVDEVLIAGGAANSAVSGAGSYSAPPAGAGAEPPDGPVRTIATSAARYSPASDFGVAIWDGLLGPVYCANADVVAPPSAEDWRRVMLYSAPG